MKLLKFKDIVMRDLIKKLFKTYHQSLKKKTMVFNNKIYNFCFDFI